MEDRVLAKPAVIKLKPGRDQRVRAGSLWIYQGEIWSNTADVDPGSIVDVVDAKDRFLGRGYFNPASQISVRVLTRVKEDITIDFFARRLQRAIAYRHRVAPEARAKRIVFSEADLLPGIIVDQYEDCLVVQILTLGMEKFRETLLPLLVDLLSPKAIVERSDANSRLHEGLSERVGVCYGSITGEIIINEKTYRYLADLGSGQKTGHFLDQRLNRMVVASYAKGLSMLDCFCHTGMFGIISALAGADSVVGVDIDAKSLRIAEKNAELNMVGAKCRFVEANAFDFLRAAVEKKEKFSLIVLDPPAFTKSKSRVEQALRGYKEINRRALQLLDKGGILVTCSCSHHISLELFQDVIFAAAADTGRQLRLRERRGQSPDHPILLGMPETEYLKCLILEDLS